MGSTHCLPVCLSLSFLFLFYISTPYNFISNIFCLSFTFYSNWLLWVRFSFSFDPILFFSFFFFHFIFFNLSLVLFLFAVILSSFQFLRLSLTIFFFFFFLFLFWNPSFYSFLIDLKSSSTFFLSHQFFLLSFFLFLSFLIFPIL